MICNQCNAKLEGDETYCTDCGAKTFNVQPEAKANPEPIKYTYFVTSLIEFFNDEDYSKISQNDKDFATYVKKTGVMKIVPINHWAKIFQVMLNHYAQNGWEFYRMANVVEPKVTKGFVGLLNSQTELSSWEMAVFRKRVN